MKKWLSYILITFYLFSNTEIKQLLKAPKLIEHYITHKKSNPKITVFAFIKMHYLDDIKKDADYKEDMKLPFKSHDFSCFNFTIQAPPKSFTFQIPEYQHFVENTQNFYYTEGFTVQLQSFIFRPPILI